jgi:4-phytase/acid phosphatase
VYADLAERTQGTAKALLDGYAPNCGYNYRSRTDAKIDPLFHPLEAGICRYRPDARAGRGCSERAGGDLNRITRDLRCPSMRCSRCCNAARRSFAPRLGRGEKLHGSPIFPR